MLAATLWGTLYPAISQLATERQASVNASFYAATVIPLALAVLALMSVGPLLFFGKTAGPALSRRLLVPGAGAAAAAILALGLGLRSWQAVAAAAIAASTALCILTDLAASLTARCRATGENPPAAAARMIAANHRRYGAQLAHLGMVLLMVGITGSSLFAAKQTIELKPGQSARVGSSTLTLNSVQEQRQANLSALDATLSLRDGSAPPRLLHPEVRTYDKYHDPDQAKREVALDCSWRRDVYVVLDGYTPADQTAVFEVTLNPLVVWVWIGALVCCLGAIVCLLPRPQTQPQEQPAALPVAQSTRAPRRPRGGSAQPGVAS